MNKVVNHSFEGGMDQDTSSFKFPNNKYQEARNLRLTVDEENGQYSFKSIKGNVHSFGFDGHYHGHCFIRDTLVLFIRNGPGDTDYILEINPESPSLLKGTSLNYTQAIFTGDLNFTEDYPISAVGIYEGDDIRKIYWADGMNPLRTLNLDGNYNNYSADDFNIIPPSDHESYTLTEIKESGSLTSGIVQYTYKFYNKYGAETYFAPLSAPYNITKGSVTNLADFKKHSGENAEEVCNRSFKFEIKNNVDPDKFTYIQVVGIYYTTAEASPVIKIIGDYEFTENTISILDSGAGYVGEYSAEEFLTIRNLFAAGSIKEKNNYLFAADITEQTFDVDIDCRTYRFDKNGKAKILETDSSYYIIYAAGVTKEGLGGSASLGDWEYFDSLGTYISSGTNWSIPEEADCICPNNYIEDDFSIDGDGGAHDGANNVAILTDTSKAWIGSSLIGATIYNITDTSSGVITANTNNTITATLSGGIDNDWDTGDTYAIDTSPIWFQYRYTATGWDHGGTVEYGATGLNTEIVINTEELTLDDEVSGHFSVGGDNWSTQSATIKDGKNPIYQIDVYGASTMENSVNPEKLGTYNNMVSPTINKSCRRDEIYRIGITFQDNYGRDSYVKWSNDFRMPRTFDYSGPSGNEQPFVLIKTDSGFLKANSIVPEISMNYTTELDTNNVVGFKAVYVERTSTNSTILDNGLVGSLEIGTNGNIFPSSLVNSGFATASEADNFDRSTFPTFTEDVKEYVSPDINFNEDFNSNSTKFVSYYEQRANIGVHVLQGTSFGRMGLSSKKYGSVQTQGQSAYAEYDISSIIKFSDTAYSQDFTRNVDSSIVLNRSKGSYSSAGSSNMVRGTCGVSAGSLGGKSYENNLFGVDVAFDSEALYVARKQIIEPYGGLSYESRLINEYEEFSETKYFNGTTASVDCYGDTYISVFEHLRTMLPINWTYADYSFEGLEVLYIPVESAYNNDFRSKESVYKLIETLYPLERLVGLHETPGVYEASTNASEAGYEQDYYLYDYNSVYTRNNRIKTYIVAPSDYDYDAIDRYDTKIIASEKKSNKETIDSWTKFLFANEMELKTEFGPITDLALVHDTLVSLQEEAVAQIAVNEREQVPGNAGVALTLGTGGILERYDYINTTNGCQSKYGHVVTPTGLYYYDGNNKGVFTLSTKGEPSIEKILNMNSWFKSQTYSDFNIRAIGYDRKHNNIMFTFNTAADEQDTLVLNDFTGFFEMFLDTNRDNYIFNSKVFYPLVNDVYFDTSFYEEDEIGTSLDGSPIECSLSIISRPEHPGPARFDIVEWNSTVKNFYTGKDHVGKTFDSIQALNSYQDTGIIRESSFKRKFRYWRLNNLRDSIASRIHTSPRLRGDWMKFIFKYTPDKSALLFDTIKIHHSPSTK